MSIYVALFVNHSFCNILSTPTDYVTSHTGDGIDIHSEIDIHTEIFLALNVQTNKQSQ